MNPGDPDYEKERRTELDKAVLGLALVVGTLIFHWIGWIP